MPYHGHLPTPTELLVELERRIDDEQQQENDRLQHQVAVEEEFVDNEASKRYGGPYSPTYHSPTPTEQVPTPTEG